MTLVDRYADATLVAGKLGNAAFVTGDKTITIVSQLEIVAADDNNSVYRIAANINPDLIPIRIEIMADAALTITDANLGIYESGASGAVIDDNALADAIDFSSGFARTAKADGLAAVAIADNQKRIYELAGHTQATKKTGYDLGFVTIAKGAGGAGTISTTMEFVQG